MSILAIVILAIMAVTGISLFFRVMDARKGRNAEPVGEPHGTPIQSWVIALVVVAAAAGLVGTGVAIVGSFSDATQRRSDDIAACRSIFRSDIDVANDTAADAESRRVDAFSDVILRSIADDLAGVQSAGQRLAVAKADVAAARAQVRAASASYAAAVKLSASDQRAFLAGCDRHL